MSTFLSAYLFAKFSLALYLKGFDTIGFVPIPGPKAPRPYLEAIRRPA
ncbi:hypothetical protein ACTXN4_09660 [Pseudomonas helleri]|nr:hypothetical protein [Pseudomonas lundensis]